MYNLANTDYQQDGKPVDFVRKRSEEYRIGFPVVYDNDKIKLAGQVGVESYPFKFILDAKGNVIAKTDMSPLSLESFRLFLSENK
jgi:hypothetical protein